MYYSLIKEVMILSNKVGTGGGDGKKRIPVISMLGDNPIEILEGTLYTDPGCVVHGYPNEEKNVLCDFSNVDVSLPGEYIVTYKYTSLDGIAATTVTRKVIVKNKTGSIGDCIDDIYDGVKVGFFRKIFHKKKNN